MPCKLLWYVTVWETYLETEDKSYEVVFPQGFLEKKGPSQRVAEKGQMVGGVFATHPHNSIPPAPDGKSSFCVWVCRLFLLKERIPWQAGMQDKSKESRERSQIHVVAFTSVRSQLTTEYQIIHPSFFSLWSSPCIMSFCFVCMAQVGNISSWVITVAYIYHIFYQSSIVGYLGWFFILAIVNKALINKGFCTLFRRSLEMGLISHSR